MSTGLAGIPTAATPTQRTDFVSGQEVRWCPGCGDYAVLAAFQSLMPELGIAKQNTVIVSGIGCSSRFPYYVDTYGMHSIHGRAPAIATGVAMARPDLAVWVMTGDGDALSIGGNHLIHALRRNVNITIVLFNNRIYGLTKGQFSPTSERGKITKSSPSGSVDRPFDPVTLALGAEASFVARTIDSDRKHLTSVLRSAVEHRGASLVEIYQNCPIFNDGAFDHLKQSDSAAMIPLEHGRPVIFAGGRFVVVRETDGHLAVRPRSEVDEASIVVHDAQARDAGLAFQLSQLTSARLSPATPIGIFRSVERPVFDDEARQRLSMPLDRQAALQKLVAGHDTWTVL
ncbi:MAG: 2-oxoacid:ferredoxin oxidoreductase subunit beta [Acidobacteriota bacterium]|nr:2-oxoacid:ferredoxin oxidoreductase subunit beta [Acidobacteriota bacterium]